MDSTSIVKFLRDNYPKVIFTPVKFPFTHAIGFIVSDGKLIVGYINKEGTLCKLHEPVELGTNVSDIVANIPIVSGFTQQDKDNLMSMFNNNSSSITEEQHLTTVNELNAKIEQLDTKNRDLDSKYRVLVDTHTKETIAIKSEYEDKIAKLQAHLDEQKRCKEQIVQQKDQIVESIQKYKEQMETYVKTKDLKIEELKAIYNQVVAEKETVQNKLQQMSTTSEEDKSILETINQELEKVKDELSKSKLKYAAVQGMQERCQVKLLQEKDEIIKSIKSYNVKWEQWVQTASSNISKQKSKLLEQMVEIERKLKDMTKSRDLDKKQIAVLKQNVTDIQLELQKTVTNQLVQLQEREDLLREKEAHLQELDEEKQQLRNDLEEVRKMLMENCNTKVDNDTNFDNCYEIIQNFMNLNNIFYRKQQIISHLERIIAGNFDSLTENFSENKRNKIKESFYKVKSSIESHIKFLDLEKYLNSPDMQYLKSKSTRNKVSPNFCSDLTNLLEYWNVNKQEYREQDRILSNIYEDLSGAVRVFVRIKPLLGKEQKSNVVTIESVEEHKQKYVHINCNGHTKRYGEFYGVFDTSYTNKDIYTGVETNIPDDGLIIDMDEHVSDTASPGLYNSFKQVEDGYSIVIFGYGLSGSGKSHTLFGSDGSPGIAQYGIANLKNVTNIKLKYLFEQYVGNIELNFGKIRGKIHNLVREVPQLREYSKNETDAFAHYLTVDVNKLRVNDLYKLTDSINQYRIEQHRIKTTPENKVSSRSHLYMVFEITFESGKVGYITIVDTAGKESPLHMFNTYIDTSKTSLASVMAPPPVGGEGLIAKVKKENLDPKHILDVIKESFYINETLNHLVYYFKKKSGKPVKVHLQSSDVNKYSTSNFFVNPILEETSINSANNCLTIPIMKFLDSLSNKKRNPEDYAPTKYIMICVLRQEEKYCEPSYKTLEFAESVKST
jgi:chromosome segregation ATPase